MTQFSNAYNFTLFSGTANLDLAKKVAKNLGVRLGQIDIKKFADGETYVNVQENVKNKNVVVMQSCSSPANENLMELLIIIDALRRLSPRKIVVCLPFYPYRRQEKKIEKGESITADLAAKLLETAGANEVLLLDLHSEIIKNFFKIPVKEINAFSIFAEYFKKKLLDYASLRSKYTFDSGRRGVPGLAVLAARSPKRILRSKYIVVAPDKGAIEKNRKLARVLRADFAYISKTRAGKHDIVAGMKIYGDVRDKNVIILDDEISTGGTLVKAADSLEKSGARDIFIAVTHGVLAGEAVKKLNKAPITEIIITDSIYLPSEKRIKKIKILSITEILANVMNYLAVS